MHKESDLVVLLADRTAKKPGRPDRIQLHRGNVGTVAYVYDRAAGRSEELYEVEFVNAAGETVAVETLRADEIRAVDLRTAMIHVTDLAA